MTRAGSLDSLNLTSSNLASTALAPKAANGCNIDVYQGTAIIAINLILSLVGTCGNFLIIIAVLTTPRLRQRWSNFLLLSLAVVDLLATICAQPLHAISMCFKTYAHYCVKEIDFAYDVMGNFAVFGSMFHLSAISIDRVIATLKPHTHQEIMRKRGLKIMLVSCWSSVVVFVCVRVPLAKAMIVSILLIFLNYAIIIVAYILILYQITRDKVKSDDLAAASSRRATRNKIMEKRVSGTIFMVILLFSICEIPLVGLYLSAGNVQIRNIGSIVYMWIRTLALASSSGNFIVYSWRITLFRAAFLRILKCILRRSRPVLELSPTEVPTSCKEAAQATQSSGRNGRIGKDTDEAIVHNNTEEVNC